MEALQDNQGEMQSQTKQLTEMPEDLAKGKLDATIEAVQKHFEAAQKNFNKFSAKFEQRMQRQNNKIEGTKSFTEDAMQWEHHTMQ